LKTRILVKKSLIVLALLITGVVQLIAQGPATFEFVENKGQWEKQVLYKGDLPAGNFFLQKNGFTVVQHNTTDLQQIRDNHGPELTSDPKSRLSNKNLRPLNNGRRITDTGFNIRSHAYKVAFIGASENPEIIPDKVLPGYSNYIIGNDPSKWKSNVKS
jgi:hypothetical protein